MSTPDYIKPGAFVRLRDGSKARIYAVDGTPVHPVHGATEIEGNWCVLIWTATGGIWPTMTSPHDITGPWIDEPDASKLWPVLPPWINWLAMDKDGTWFGYPTEPDLCDECWIRPGVCWVPPDRAPTFTGDWKQSKIRRPQ
jgi:hypothetical protein